jgi:hypothetical protein
MRRLDNFWISLAIGLVLPLLFGLLFFSIFGKGQLPLFDALQLYATSAPMLISKMLLVACVPNLFGVFIFYHAQWWRACRGFIVPILLYFAVAMLFI